MRTRTFTLAIILALTVAPLSIEPPTAHAATYSSAPTATQIIPMASWNAEAIDQAGSIHVAYARYDGAGLWYATDAGGSWVSIRVSTLSVDEGPGIAVDDQGYAHIAFLGHGSEGSGIRYATNRTGSWVVTRLTNEGTDRFPSIAVDGKGEVHIAYGESNLVYLTNRRGYWSRLSLVASGASHPSIALAADGRVHIAFQRPSAGIAHITDSNGMSWVTTTVANQGEAPDIAVHGTTPRIAYGGSSGIYYAAKGASWSNVRVRATISRNTPSIALDAVGTAYISYEYDAYSGQSGVDLVTNATGSWVRTVVGNGQRPTVLLETDGSVAVVFSSTALYLRRIGAEAATRSLVQTSAYSMDPDITIGPDGLPRMAMIRQWDTPGVRVGTWTGSGFTVRRITTSADRSPSIAVDAAGASHVAFIRTNSPNELWYGTDATGSWVFTQLDAQDVISCPSIALGSTGKVHVVAHREYSIDGFLFVRVANYSNATGTFVTRDDLPMVTWPGCPDIVVNGANADHIVYNDGVQPRYTRLSNGAWLSSTLGQANDDHVRIARTSNGAYVIAYARQNDYADPDGGIYVRTNRTGAWVTTRVGKTADWAPFALATGPGDSIHLAYRGISNDLGLLHTTDAGGSWTTTRLADQEPVGPAIGISNDKAEVLYYGNMVNGGTTGTVHIRAD